MDRSDPKRLSPVQPFVLTRLSDVVPQSVLRSLQTGIATEHRIGLALVEPDNGGFHYLPPSHAGTAGCRFCSILRGVDEGRALCEACDFSIARRVMEQGPGSGPQWVECHMGLCGLAMPIVVADRVAAVFLSGQKVWPGSRDSVRAQARRVGDQIADLDHEALIAAGAGLDERTEQERARIGQVWREGQLGAIEMRDAEKQALRTDSWTQIQYLLTTYIRAWPSCRRFRTADRWRRDGAGHRLRSSA